MIIFINMIYTVGKYFETSKDKFVTVYTVQHKPGNHKNYTPLFRQTV